MSVDYHSLVSRYLGRRVCITLYSHNRLWGTLKTVGYDSLRLTDVVSVGELDDQSWFSQMNHADPDTPLGPVFTETIVRFDHVLSVTCPEENLPEPICDGQESLLSTDDDDDDEESPFDEVAGDEQGANKMGECLHASPLVLELGAGLLPLADTRRGGRLLPGIAAARKGLAERDGAPLPTVRICDNLQLENYEYRILVFGREVARATAPLDQCLALGTENARGTVDGDDTLEPCWTLPARRIASQDRAQAEAAGCRVVDSTQIILTHLTELSRRHAGRLLDCDRFDLLLNTLKHEAPALVKELRGGPASIATLRRVAQLLADDGLADFRLRAALESLAFHSHQSANVEELADRVRIDLAQHLCDPLRDAQGRLPAVTLSPAFEDALLTVSDSCLAGLLQTRGAGVARRLRRLWESRRVHGERLALLTHAKLRRRLQRLLRSELPDLDVLAREEVPIGLLVDVLATLDLDDADGGKPAVIDVLDHDAPRDREIPHVRQARPSRPSEAPRKNIPR